MRTVRRTEVFKKKFEKLIPQQLQEKLLEQLRRTTTHHGRFLTYKLKEKKHKKWRFYFTIEKGTNNIIFVDVSDKKLQQETINKIKGT